MPGLSPGIAVFSQKVLKSLGGDGGRLAAPYSWRLGILIAHLEV